MTDPEFLHWVAHRLVNVYNEHPNTDFVTKLHEIADKLEKEQHVKDFLQQSLNQNPLHGDPYY